MKILPETLSSITNIIQWFYQNIKLVTPQVVQNLTTWPCLCTSVALGWLSGLKFCHPIVRSLHSTVFFQFSQSGDISSVQVQLRNNDEKRLSDANLWVQDCWTLAAVINYDWRPEIAGNEDWENDENDTSDDDPTPWSVDHHWPSVLSQDDHLDEGSLITLFQGLARILSTEEGEATTRLTASLQCSDSSKNTVSWVSIVWCWWWGTRC